MCLEICVYMYVSLHVHVHLWNSMCAGVCVCGSAGNLAVVFKLIISVL